MNLLVRAFPIIAPREALVAFAAELNGSRASQAEAFYRGYGVAHESWHLQETAQGLLMISVTVLAEVAQAAEAYAASNAEFDRWFKDRARAVSGIDLDTQPLGPPTVQVFAWPSRDGVPASLFAQAQAVSAI
jgi:hypothetical protein